MRERRSGLVHSKILYWLEEERCRITSDFSRSDKFRDRKRNKEKSPKWNAKRKVAERNPSISVITVIQTDYINGRDHQIGF